MKKGNCWPVLKSLSPWGSERNNMTRHAGFFHCGCKKDLLRLLPFPAFRFAPIRVREKRMNTHMTAAEGLGLSEDKQIHCKNLFTSGNLFLRATY
jgi:hypothetical protein